MADPTPQIGLDWQVNEDRLRSVRVDEGGYEKGDRVWVRSGTGARLPGVVIGRHLPWDLYRVAYMVDVAGRGPRAIEAWRLAHRRRDEPSTSGNS